MKNYYFDEKKRFIIEDYDKAKTFSSFLPGIAGVEGIPIWAFYVNRGQGICSFGLENKKNPIMEFSPANVAYQTVTTNGFRTFIKDLSKDGEVFEPFGANRKSCQRKMGIEKDRFFIHESNEDQGIETRVSYTTLTNVPFGGLVRRTEITNTSEVSKSLEIVDGMPALLPYGVDNETYKEMSNLMQSWMEVSNRDTTVPFYKLRSSTEDVAVVSEIKSGYFYLSESIVDEDVLNIYDASLIFDYQSDLRDPVGFREASQEVLKTKEQVFANKVPSAFQLLSRVLEPGAKVVLNSIIGYAQDYDGVSNFAKDMDLDNFVESQFQSCKTIVDEICSEIETHTGLSVFDEYMKQTYLDNVLRGGRPYIFKASKGNHVYHLFSRKHGDLERDYNFFSLEPSKYSQGNGNYRDVNQNRRNDVVMNPEVKDFNVWLFYNLVQADGYNPLSIKGTTFTVEADALSGLASKLKAMNLVASDVTSILEFAVKAFTPGSLSNFLERLTCVDQEVFDAVLQEGSQAIDVAFGEGFWSDHFTYNLDLVESYRYMYPDQMDALLFQRMDYKFYNAPYRVLPRSLKYGLNEGGQVRQYEAIIKKETYESQWLRDENGQLIKTNLFNKMLILNLTKFMNLDAFAMGIEMEGERPGWNDALNGLPGLFGSGMSETVELKRCVDFLLDALEKTTLEPIAIEVLSDIADLIPSVRAVLIDQLDAFQQWDRLNNLKEDYREKTQDVYSSNLVKVSVEDLKTLLSLMQGVLATGIAKAKVIGDGVLPSYFINEVMAYEVTGEKTHYGLDGVKVKEFSHRALPLFLEAPARYMKTLAGEEARELHRLVTASGIYDQELGMYKTSASLDGESMEIGRIRAFTPGWLERESVFMHMTYKYLLGLLSAGLYDDFYRAIKTNMVPFLDPAIYGRPTTENSSFVASSVNPNPAVTGQGFVARLSGSTAEAISMWIKMFIGEEGFVVNEGQLECHFGPKLSSEFFDKQGEVKFKMFASTEVTYVNKSGRATFGPDAAVVERILVDGVEEGSSYLQEASATRLRNKEVAKVVIYLR